MLLEIAYDDGQLGTLKPRSSFWNTDKPGSWRWCVEEADDEDDPLEEDLLEDDLLDYYTDSDDRQSTQLRSVGSTKRRLFDLVEDPSDQQLVGTRLVDLVEGLSDQPLVRTVRTDRWSERFGPYWFKF